jgi:hypothetical protein
MYEKVKLSWMFTNNIERASQLQLAEKLEELKSHSASDTKQLYNII